MDEAEPVDPTALEVREAMPADVPALDALYRRAATVWPDDASALAAAPEALESQLPAVRAGRVRLATAADGTLLGFVAVRPVSERVWELDDLFVEPALFRRGVGRRLVEDVVRRARAAGVRQIEVTANDNALGFYERVGFEQTGELVPTRFRPAPRMVRDVTG